MRECVNNWAMERASERASEIEWLTNEAYNFNQTNSFHARYSVIKLSCAKRKFLGCIACGLGNRMRTKNRLNNYNWQISRGQSVFGGKRRWAFIWSVIRASIRLSRDGSERENEGESNEEKCSQAKQHVKLLPRQEIWARQSEREQREETLRWRPSVLPNSAAVACRTILASWIGAASERINIKPKSTKIHANFLQTLNSRPTIHSHFIQLPDVYVWVLKILEQRERGEKKQWK